MSTESSAVTGSSFSQLMRGALAVLAILVVARLVLELAGVPQEVVRFFSSTVAMPLVGLYVAAVGPLRGGLHKLSQHVLPALILAAWTEGWIIVVTIVASVFHLSRSHFAEPEDFGNWSHLGRHLLGHILEIGIFFLVVLVLMAIINVLWRWPIIVGPGALLGAVVIIRFWTEAMNLDPFRSSAWSSTVLVFLSAFYLGGVGARMGLTEARQLFIPSLVLGWVWQGWVYLAKLFAAAVPFFHTHFFDPARGAVPRRLLGALGGAVVEGFIIGLFLWGIAVWIACATQPETTSGNSGEGVANGR